MSGITHLMQTPGNAPWRGLELAGFLAVSLIIRLALPALAADTSKDKAPTSTSGLVPLIIDLPGAAFKGTPPNDLQTNANVEPVSEKPRPPLMVPPGLKNLAPASKLTSSDKNATAEILAKLTDGDKDASDQSMIFLRKGLQWVQLDLGNPYELFALVIWHAHDTLKVYHDVVVQVAEDADFIRNVRTLFNNDRDNTMGLGIGADREYFETFEGKLINAKGVKVGYVRFYSCGSTSSPLNEYTEVEVYGRPSR